MNDCAPRQPATPGHHRDVPLFPQVWPRPMRVSRGTSTVVLNEAFTSKRITCHCGRYGAWWTRWQHQSCTFYNCTLLGLIRFRVLPSRPKLVEGAFSKYEQYTLRDLAGLKEYAAVRGIRVIVEIDTPGHAASWCVGMPELCPAPSGRCRQPLDPTLNETFETD